MEKLELQLIVVGVDGSPADTDALEWAVAEARATGARVEAVYAGAPGLATAGQTPEHHAAELVYRVVGEEPGIRVVPRMVIGRAAEILVDESTRADLLVVGSRGVGGLEGIELGSVSHHCAAHAECPLVIVPHDPLRSRATVRTSPPEKAVAPRMPLAAASGRLGDDAPDRDRNARHLRRGLRDALHRSRQAQVAARCASSLPALRPPPCRLHLSLKLPGTRCATTP